MSTVLELTTGYLITTPTNSMLVIGRSLAYLRGHGPARGRRTLQEQIPQAEVGADGAPPTAVQTLEGDGGGEKPAPVDAGASEATPEPAPLPEAGPAPTEAIPTPSVSAGEGGTVAAEDATRVQGAVDELPTQDPGLDVPAGAPPTVQLTGDADPATADQQKAELDKTVAAQRTQGAIDAAAPAGENAIRVTRPKEVIKGPTVTDAAGGGAAAAADAAASEEGVGIIANEKKGPEVRAAMAQAQGDMAAKKAEHQEKVTEEKTKNDEQMAALKEENLAQQEAEKAGAKGEVAKARSDWTAEQRKEITTTNEKAGKEVSKGNEKVTQEQTKADADANQHIADGEKQAAEEKAKAERDAAAKKAEAKKESGGIFGWLSSKVSSFFNAIKNGITAIFDAAKKLVRAAIEAAKKLAVAVIEAARKAIVSIIKAVGAALILLGDVFLAAFPGLRKKWRSFIETRVRNAENAVNRLADALKKGVTKLLDLLGKAFEFLLDAYKKAMFMVLDAAKAAVDGAIKFAKAAAELLGTFVVLIKDIASNPGGWISNLGAAVMDGVKNHLWKAFKAAIKEWFNAKLEEVLGVGMTIWNVLKKGGISLKEVGTMAFEALKAAIPAALIQLLIEKVVAMIVPAAGAVMAIIEGLQAAWGTIQRIIAALGKFVSFLKAVKAGGAGPQFAELLAAAAIVVIDFVANWLLRKLRGPASKVGSKVKAIAQKIMAKIKAAMKKVGGALKKVAKKIGGVFKKAKKKFADWRAKRKAKKDAKNAGKKKDPSQKKKDKEAEKRKRLERAERELTPKLDALFRKGVGKLRLRMTLGWWRIRYRLSSLTFDGSAVVAKVNPTGRFSRAEVLQLAARLEPVLERVERQFLAALDRTGGHLPVQYGPLRPTEHRSTGSVVNQLSEDKRFIERVSFGDTPLKWGKTAEGKEKRWSDIVHTPSGAPLHATQRREGGFVPPQELKVGHGVADYPALQRGVPGLGMSPDTVSTLATETVRAPGMLPVYAMAHQAATLEAQAKGILPGSAQDQAMAQRLLGAQNPMESKGSGRAGVQDYWGVGKPEPADPTKTPSKAEQQKSQETQAARDARRSKIWRVFSHLRRVVHQNKSMIGQAPALEQVTKDFEKYANVAHPERASDPEAIQQSLDNLERSLLAFMLTLK